MKLMDVLHKYFSFTGVNIHPEHYPKPLERLPNK